MHNKAFTLIELIIVISIIILLSWSWVFYFTNYIDQVKIDSNISMIREEFNSFDEQINDRSIYYYELNLKKDSYVYIFYKNSSNTWLNLRFDNNFDYKFASWTLRLIPTIAISYNWSLSLYSDNKYQYNKFLSWSDSVDFSFNNTYMSNNIVSYLSWNKMNDVYVNYFIKPRSLDNSQDFIYLTSINQKQDKTWKSYDNLIIKNILWQKILSSSGDILDEVFLFFEYNSKESFIKITK